MLPRIINVATAGQNAGSLTSKASSYAEALGHTQLVLVMPVRTP
jgi:hypothetical protein